MRKLEDLTGADFPELDPQKFEEWKQARIQANRYAAYFVIGLVVLNVILFVTTGSLVLGGLLLLLVIVGIERRPGRLWKELGLTRKALKEARTRPGPPPAGAAN